MQLQLIAAQSALPHGSGCGVSDCMYTLLAGRDKSPSDMRLALLRARLAWHYGMQAIQVHVPGASCHACDRLQAELATPTGVTGLFVRALSCMGLKDIPHQTPASKSHLPELLEGPG